MTSDAWNERRKALEESFFQGRNQELLANLREKLAAEETKNSLSATTGILDENVLDQLIGAKISSQTMAALALVPVVVVAWADGEIADQERAAVLKAGESEGIVVGSVSHELIECWLNKPPGPELLAAWKTYTRSLLEHMSEDSIEQVRSAIVGRAERVAAAAGGILGVNRISQSEQNVLDELRAALSR